MNLEEFLWRARKTYRQFAAEAGTSQQGMCQYVAKKHSPGLFCALKIHVASGGKVSLIELLSMDDLNELQEMIQELKKNRDCKDDFTYDAKLIESIEQMIDSARKGRSHELKS